jgi:ectoine hydroxylase-related dioxygenase (phytanoyl-CoA dioxygenase family)
MDETQVAAFQRDGYLLLPRFFDAGEVAEITRWTEELASAPEEIGSHWVYREASLLDPEDRIIQRIENFCPFHDGFDRLVRQGRLMETVSRLFGEQAVLFKEKINFKMPGGAGFKAHQDQQAGWSTYAPLFITALVGIDASTLENGCLEVAPGWHRQGLLGEEWKPLDDDRIKEVGLKPVPTGPGDVLLFDSYVPHASAENMTGAARRILYLTYNRLSDGDHREAYYRDKSAAFPPDVARVPGSSYVFRV